MPSTVSPVRLANAPIGSIGVVSSAASRISKIPLEAVAATGPILNMETFCGGRNGGKDGAHDGRVGRAERCNGATVGRWHPGCYRRVFVLRSSPRAFHAWRERRLDRGPHGACTLSAGL